MKRNTWDLFQRSLSGISLLMFVVIIFAVGCSTDNSTGPSDDGNGGNTADSVSFADDVLPIFQASCAGGSCHVPGPEPKTGLSLASYQELMNGGVVVAGDADASEIIKRLEGSSQPSMPFGQALLSSSTVKKVRDWIDQGAKDN